MAVLVTGGGGYIGSHMVWVLLEAGEDVVVIDRLSTGFRWAIPPEARFYEGDIADRELLARIFSENPVDSVIHFAGSIVVPDSVSDPLGYYENNTVKSRALIASVVEAGIPHFVFSSTAAVYGTPEVLEPVTETVQLRPESPYGSSKLMTEIMLRDAAAAHDLTYTVLRYFNVAGADPKGRSGQSSKTSTHLIKIACAVALGKRASMNVFGTDYPTPDGTCVRDYIHVDDLARGHILALQFLLRTQESQTFNLGLGQGHSILDLLDACERVVGVRPPHVFRERRPGDPPALVADAAKAKRMLGFEPEITDLDAIVRTALMSLRSVEKTLLSGSAR